MIDRNNHFDRYDALMSLVSSGAPARRKDGGYMAALYILSADSDLSRMAHPCAGTTGIDFKQLLAAAERRSRSFEAALSRQLSALQQTAEIGVI